MKNCETLFMPAAGRCASATTATALIVDVDSAGRGPSGRRIVAGGREYAVGLPAGHVGNAALVGLPGAIGEEPIVCRQELGRLVLPRQSFDHTLLAERSHARALGGIGEQIKNLVGE